MRSLRLTSWFSWLLCGLSLAACNDGNSKPGSDGPGIEGDGESDFVSAVSNGSGGRGDSLNGGDAQAPSAAGTTQSGNAADGDNAGSANRAIAEADILQLAGDRIYALSQYSGLSIVDASNPRALRLEGNYRTSAAPFEMYVEDGIVFAMFNSWSSYECDEVAGTCTWQQASRLQALDTRDPANIVRLADYVVPGTIADSRRVGDILYLATQEYGGCWGCNAAGPNTNMTSFDVSDVTALRQVDQLRFPARDDSYLGQRSISVTQERIYVSGWDWNFNNQSGNGSIQVVDISDPQGALVAGATVPIAGQIQSRWQMDEFDGVLRVISQPGGWGGAIPPVLETFRVTSASDIQRLKGIGMQLPRPNETLMSARFDGERAYAITMERRDPLVTFDLSDPANPLQVGLLDMPGWVYHMEPRGDRLLALGYDNENQSGSLNVSLFDVSNLATPQLLSRVPFGGDWGSFAEDQDRIHKAFSILDDEGLIFVPFAGGSYDEASCTYDYGSGIQLVEFTNDSLTKRGVAPQVGNARRALLHDGYLFGIGDNAVQTFDISNRDAPQALAQLDVARNITGVRVLGDHLLRFGNDWWTDQTTLDLTPIDRAGEPEPQSEIDLSALFGENTWSCGRSSQWSGEVFVKGNYAYVPRYSYNWSNVDYRQYEQRLTLYVVDLSDRNAPRAIGTVPLQPVTGDYYSFSGIVQTDNTLLVGRSKYGRYDYDYRTGKQTLIEAPQYYYDVIDLRNPATPEVVNRFEVPAELASYGYGYGYALMGCSIDMPWGWYRGGNSGTITDGDIVVSQHGEPLPGDDTQVRYYMDRIDVSDPLNPVVYPKVNIPGNVVHFNADTNELVTVDYRRFVEPAEGGTYPAVYESCSNRGAYGWYDEKIEACRVERRAINSLVLEGNRAVRKSILRLDEDRRTANIAVSDDRLFYTTTTFPNYATVRAGTIPLSDVKLESLVLQDGQLHPLATVELEPAPYYWGGSLFARGDRVFEVRESELTVVDTSVPSDPVSKKVELPGYYCSALEVSADRAYCALGQRGVEVIDLSDMR
jgi:hypothetical protein